MLTHLTVRHLLNPFKQLLLHLVAFDQHAYYSLYHFKRITELRVTVNAVEVELHWEHLYLICTTPFYRDCCLDTPDRLMKDSMLIKLFERMYVRTYSWVNLSWGFTRQALPLRLKLIHVTLSILCWNQSTKQLFLLIVETYKPALLLILTVHCDFLQLGPRCACNLGFIR